MQTKFQLYNLIKKKVKPSIPLKGREAALTGVNQNLCIPLQSDLFEQYTYQISASYLYKQKKNEKGGRGT